MNWVVAASFGKVFLMRDSQNHYLCPFDLSFPRRQESALVCLMDTRLCRYDTTSGKGEACKDNETNCVVDLGESR